MIRRLDPETRDAVATGLATLGLFVLWTTASLLLVWAASEALEALR